MTTLTIKDVPEAMAEQLRRRAARNHRSLQGELMSIIEQAVQSAANPGAQAAAMAPWVNAASAAPQALGQGLRSGGVLVGMTAHGPVVRQGWKTVEQVDAELRAKYPAPIHDQASSIDLIREDRDSR